jgi:hypothetical protein
MKLIELISSVVIANWMVNADKTFPIMEDHVAQFIFKSLVITIYVGAIYILFQGIRYEEI